MAAQVHLASRSEPAQGVAARLLTKKARDLSPTDVSNRLSLAAERLVTTSIRGSMLSGATLAWSFYAGHNRCAWSSVGSDVLSSSSTNAVSAKLFSVATCRSNVASWYKELGKTHQDARFPMAPAPQQSGHMRTSSKPLPTLL